MPSFGKLYTYAGNARSTAIKAVAAANNVELELVTVDTSNPDAEYLKINKLGKVPTFVGADGYVLHEAIAIAIYSMYTKLAFYSTENIAMMKQKSYSYPCLNHPC